MQLPTLNEVLDELDRRSYLHWYNRVSPRFPAPRHIEWLIENYIERVISGECKRLIISMPPQHVKSDAVTRKLPVYWGLRFPGENSLITGYSQRFAEKYLSEPARDLADEVGLLAKNSTALDSWKFTTGGSVSARGVGAPPTGIPRLKLIIVDDPIKSREEASSEVVRENIWQWWTGSIVQRFWEDTRVIIIMTRWHEDDLVGRITAQENHGWEVVNLASIAEENDLFGRKEGEALWPELKPVSFLESQREEMGDFEFEALFQGNPTPREGALIKVARITEIAPSEVPEGLFWSMCVDNGSTVAGDPTACVFVARDAVSGRVYIDPHRDWLEPYERDKWLRLMADTREPNEVLGQQDPGAAGKAEAQNFVRLFAGFAVHVAPVSGDKEQRVTPLASQVNAGNVYVVKNSHSKAFIEEGRQFPLGKHDDMWDAAADGFNRAARKGKKGAGLARKGHGLL